MAVDPSARRRASVLAQHMLLAPLPPRTAPAAVAARPQVCLVLGAGAGIGEHVARRFARAGYVACLCRRSNQAALDRAVAAIADEGGEARGFIVNAAAPGAIEEVVRRIEAEVGDVAVAVYNLGAQIGHRPLDALDLRTFELGWRLGCEGLFRLAKAVTPGMVARGSGVLLVTSATAAVRGNAGQHSHAAAMGGRRMLCQTLNHEFASKGIHTCHIVVDGAVNAPDTLGKMLGAERFQKLQEMGDAILQPADVAESFFHIAAQRSCAWTFELDLRPSATVPWWNS